MEILNASIVKKLFYTNKELALFGKWIRLKDIEPLFSKFNSVFDISVLGNSEEERQILKFKVGSGDKKILLWSQMHGNESTGTKALFDLFNCFLANDSDIIKKILKECTLVFVPMLNPDGSEYYTRVNANNIDLNRDAVDRSAKESKLLRNLLEEFKPDFCFNLHDQRTIFSVEGTKNPATISFLAPSEDLERTVTKGRTETMSVIVAMNELIQSVLPNQVGRYPHCFVG